MEYAALIMAAGSGERMELGYNKLFYRLQNGQSVLSQTMRIFCEDPRCKQIVLVIAQSDEEMMRQECSDPRIEFVYGGATRQASVYHGLCQIRETKVLIHDGARPWLSKDCLDRLLICLQDHRAALLCVAVKDTIKQVKDGCVLATPQRETLMQAQTPQGFDTELILAAYQKGMELGVVASDDAQLMEICGEEQVYVVEGSYENMKVTTKEDVHGK